jgi:probable HAF family extracellular repeat protein
LPFIAARYYTTLDDPLATNGTQASGINDAGQIVGTYNTSNGTHAFVYSGGFFTTIDDPVNGHTFAYGINNNSQIVGTLSDNTGNHGFLETTMPNPPPPASTTADMILRGSNTSPAVAGQYEIYDIGNNAILAGYSLGQVGTDWAFITLGGFNGSDTTDMLLRSSSTGDFEVYDISNNNITNAGFLGNVGMDWQAMGFGNFGSFGETDMMLRNVNTGGVEVYDISNNQIIGANFMGTVGLNWQVGGFGNFSSRGTSDMILRNTQTGGLEVMTSTAIKLLAPPSWAPSGWIGRSSASAISAACRAKPT